MKRLVSASGGLENSPNGLQTSVGDLLLFSVGRGPGIASPWIFEARGMGSSSRCLPPWLDLEPQSAAFEKGTDQETQSLPVLCHREADGKRAPEDAGFTVRRTKF